MPCRILFSCLLSVRRATVCTRRFVFAIVGVSLFKGSFWFCNDALVTGRFDCVGTYGHGDKMLRRNWSNPPTNFDNIFKALFSLWAVSTLDSWWETAYMAIDMVEVDSQPRRDDEYGRLYMLYFVRYPQPRILITLKYQYELFLGLGFQNMRFYVQNVLIF